MKILTKEEEQDHYNATIKGGIMGGFGGLAAGMAGVVGLSRRYPVIRGLSLPFRAFLVTSTGTFSAIIYADRYSRSYEASRHPEKEYTDNQQTLQEQIEAQKPFKQRAFDWASNNRYSIVFGSWVASIGGAFALVGRNPYLTGTQKLVQARVYAQGLTMAIVIASLALEAKDRNQGEGRWETVKVLDPNDPTHQRLVEKKIHHERYAGEDQWMDMVAAEEDRMKERQAAIKQREAAVHKQTKHDDGKGKKDAEKDA